MQRLRGLIGLLVVTTVLASPLSAAAANTGADGDAAALSVAQSSNIEIVGADMPAEMVPGKEYEMTVDIRNSGDSAKQVEVRYNFDGGDVIYFEELVAAGETITASVRVDLRMITQSYRGTIYDGTYEHSIQVGDAIVRRNVTISGLGTPTPTPTPIENVETVAEETDSTATGGTDVVVRQVAFPEQIPAGGEAEISIAYRNPTETMSKLPIRLVFDGREIVTDRLEVPPGEDTMDLPIGTRMLEGDRETLEPGTYPWTLVVGGAEHSGSVDIVASGESGSTQAATESDDNSATGATAEPAVTADDQPKRGFFSNGESQFQFLDSFSLTVGGFALSVLGIFYQMLQGA